MLENTGALKIYPSGFMGSASQPQTAVIDLRAMSRELVQSGLTIKKSPYTANLNVVELDMAAVSGTADSRSFEYCERVLKVALTAFGVQRVLPWIEAQLQSPEMSDNHKNYIDETLLFAIAGRGRRMSNNSWKAILTVGDNTLSKKTTSGVVNHLIKGLRDPKTDISLLGNREDLTFKELIGMWVTQPGGIRDLRAGLTVFFGER
jgi:hypothetical protein